MTLPRNKTCSAIAIVIALPLVSIADPPFGQSDDPSTAQATEDDAPRPGAPNPARQPADTGMSVQDLIGVMKAGGNVIYVRHATTNKDWSDQVSAVMGDCSTQRSLSELGWEEAKGIGAAFERSEIPVGDVISSQYCRAWQTADLAFGDYTKNADLNFAPADDYTDQQWQTMSDNMTKHFIVEPAEGINTILVGRDDPFNAATGIYPDPMGVVFVIKPSGDGKFQVLGSIAPTQWPTSG